MTLELRWCEHRNAAAMALGLARALHDAITAALAERGVATLALAGGTTPWPAYQQLAARPLPWQQVIILPTDDRMVPRGHALSNVSGLAGIFEPLGARVEALTDASSHDHVEAGRTANERLHELPWPLDFVLLGVGTDGHTASIFAGPDYAAAIDRGSSTRALGVLPAMLPVEAPVARVSLSLPAIAAARAVVLVAVGTAKRAVIERAIADGPQSDYPIGRVLAAIPSPVRIDWTPQ